MNPIFLNRPVVLTPKAKRFVLVCGLLAGLGSFGLTSCSTVKGFGNDVERGGEKLQNAADRNR